MTITTLDGITTGRFVVTTQHGTRHLIDLDARTITRQGAPGREWGDQILVADPLSILSGTQPKVAAHYGSVTPDGAPMHIRSLRDATVGKSMYVENSDEWRQTSTVVSIERIN